MRRTLRSTQQGENNGCQGVPVDFSSSEIEICIRSTREEFSKKEHLFLCMHHDWNDEQVKMDVKKDNQDGCIKMCECRCMNNVEKREKQYRNGARE